MHINPISILDKIENGSAIEKGIITAIAVEVLLTSYPLNIDHLKEGAKQGIVVGLVTSLLNMARLLYSHYHYIENNGSKKDNQERNIFYKFFNYLKTEIIGPVIAGPIDEEVIMRGALLPLIKSGCLSIHISSYYSSVFAIINSALIFALMHHPFEESAQSSAFLGGLAYGLLKEKNNNLWAPTIAHMTHNAFIMFMGATLDFVFKQPELKASHEKPYIYSKELPKPKEKTILQSIPSNKPVFSNNKTNSHAFFTAHKKLKKKKHKFRDITDEEMADSIFGKRIKLKA